MRISGVGMLSRLAMVACLALAACDAGAAGSATPSLTSLPASAPESGIAPSLSSQPSALSSAPSVVPGSVAGKTVVLDPGHNGGNGSHPAEINRKVPDGRGGTKPCNTTGTATNAGYPEHAFTWDVSQRVQALLVAKGVIVRLTRANDTGVGPCVDVRGVAGNSPDVAAVVAIHADGAVASGYGFHVAYSAPPLNDVQRGPSIELATTLRDGLRSAAFTPSTYIGTAGLSPRPDLAGLNLAQRPTALIECANMRNPTEAALVSSPDGRARYAAAIADGIEHWLAAH